MPIHELIERDIQDRVYRAMKTLGVDPKSFSFFIGEIPEDPTSASPPPRGVRINFIVDGKLKPIDVPFGPELDANILAAVRSTFHPEQE